MNWKLLATMNGQKCLCIVCIVLTPSLVTRVSRRLRLPYFRIMLHPPILWKAPINIPLTLGLRHIF